MNQSYIQNNVQCQSCEFNKLCNHFPKCVRLFFHVIRPSWSDQGLRKNGWGLLGTILWPISVRPGARKSPAWVPWWPISLRPVVRKSPGNIVQCSYSCSCGFPDIISFDIRYETNLAMELEVSHRSCDVQLIGQRLFILIYSCSSAIDICLYIMSECGISPHVIM